VAGDDEIFMTGNLDVMPKTTEQHLIVLSDKSVSYGTNNKKNCARRFVLFKLTTERHEARPLCDSRASCSCEVKRICNRLCG